MGRSFVGRSVGTMACWLVCAGFSLSGSAGGLIVPVGPEFQVNTYTTGDQLAPAVGMADDGRFLVVWRDAGSTNAQRFDADGVRQGPELRIPLTTGSSGFTTSATMGPDGDFVVLWDGYKSGQGWSVQAQRYDASGNLLGGTIQVTASGYRPSIARSPSGEFAVVWENTALRTHGALFTAEGAPMGPVFNATTPTMTQEFPTVAMDPVGNFVVGTASYGEDIEYSAFANFFDRHGNALGASGSFFRFATGLPSDPALAMNGPGDFLGSCSALFSVPPIGYDHEIVGRIYRAGVATTPLFLMNTTLPAPFGLGARETKIAKGRDGRFLVVWSVYLGGASSTEVRGQAFLADGSRDGTEFAVNTYTPLQQSRPQVATDGADRFVVAWTSRDQDGSGYGVFAQRFCRLGGPPRGGEARIDAAGTGSRTRPRLASRGGEFLVVWESDLQDGSSSGVYGRRLDAAGGPLGGEFRVNVTAAGSQSRPAAAASSPGSVVVWQSEAQDGSLTGVYGRRYDAAGNAAGGEFPVNVTTSGAQDSPAVGEDPSGGFVVVWRSDGQDGSGGGIFGRRFDASGGALGTEIPINALTGGEQGAPAVASDDDGGFTVVWQSAPTPGDGSGSGIFARRFDPAGGPLGPDFQVNTTTASDQDTPAIASSGEPGTFVVVWRSAAQDGSGTGIFARRYAAGIPQGGEFAVNEHTAGDQGRPSVSMDASGAFTATWESDGQDGHLAGIYARHFDADGAPSSERAVNVTTCGAQQSPTAAMDPSGGSLVVWSSPQNGSATGILGRRFAEAGCPLPAVTAPFDRALCEGMEAAFLVSAEGAGPFTYRWRENGVDLVDGGRISGAASSTLFVAGIGAADVGKAFDCVVTDGCAPSHAVVSKAATVSLTPGAIQDFRVRKTGTQIYFEWTDLATANDYFVFESMTPGGSFSDLVLHANSGIERLPVQPGAGNHFYLAYGRNALCNGPLH